MKAKTLEEIGKGAKNNNIEYWYQIVNIKLEFGNIN
jgi:hypothetical protein